MYKSPSLSSIHFPCSYSFAGSPPAHPFFIRINEKFHVSWSFNIITGTFKAFSVMLCTHLQSLSVDIYIFCLIHRHSGHWLCDYGHSLYKTPHTHIQSNSRRRIVRQIYYAHKFSTSFVFSIGKCEWQFRWRFFSSLRHSLLPSFILVFSWILSNSREQPLKMAIACGYNICTILCTCVSFLSETFYWYSGSPIKITKTFINSKFSVP